MNFIKQLDWIEPTHSMLYQLSYQTPGSKMVGRKGIQVLILGVHYIKLLVWNTPGGRCCHLWHSARCSSHQAQFIKEI